MQSVLPYKYGDKTIKYKFSILFQTLKSNCCFFLAAALAVQFLSCEIAQEAIDAVAAKKIVGEWRTSPNEDKYMFLEFKSDGICSLELKNDENGISGIIARAVGARAVGKWQIKDAQLYLKFEEVTGILKGIDVPVGEWSPGKEIKLESDYRILIIDDQQFHRVSP